LWKSAAERRDGNTLPAISGVATVGIRYGSDYSVHRLLRPGIPTERWLLASPTYRLNVMTRRWSQVADNLAFSGATLPA
jgi:hypothetical protein